MRIIVGVVCVFGLLPAAYGANPKANPALADDRNTIVIVFKDGHKQSYPMADIANIEFKTPVIAEASLPIPSRNHFIGKWEVGEGNGDNFFITLEADGVARKSLGKHHGTWTVVDGEARITWDDGWHDAIRKVGAKHEKVAFEPGKSFSDEPSNITAARNTQPKPL
jgi:hypothetical protein